MDSFRDRTLTPVSGGILAIGLLVWAFAWSNAQTFAQLVDSSRTTLLPIPHAAKFLEVAAVTLLFGASLLHSRKRNQIQQSGVALLLCLVLLGTISTAVSVLSGLVSISFSLQAIYTYFSPLLIASAMAVQRSSREDISRIRKAFVFLVGVSVAMAWYQFAVRGYFSDNVHGFMRDAHRFASAVWAVVLWCIARLLTGAGSRAWNLAGILTFSPMALAAANEKSNVALGIVLFVAGVLALWRWNWVGRLLVVASGIVTIYTARAVAAGDIVVPTYFAHVQFVMENLSGIGFVKGYKKLGHVVAEYPRIWVIGTGPASYGSTKAIDQVVRGGTIPPLAAEYTAESYRLNYVSTIPLGSYVEQSTDVSAFLVEFGAISLLLFLTAIWFLVVHPARRAMRHADPEMAAFGRWVIFAVSFVGLMSVFSASYGWANIEATVWPIMLVAGLLSGGVLDEDGMAADADIVAA